MGIRAWHAHRVSRELAWCSRSFFTPGHPVQGAAQGPAFFSVRSIKKTRKHHPSGKWGDITETSFTSTEVGAVIEIETAEKILVGFAAASVLRNYHAGNRLENLSRTKYGTILELLRDHGPLTGGSGNSDEVVFAALYLDGSDHRADGERSIEVGGYFGGGLCHIEFLHSKIGVRHNHPVMTRLQSGNDEGPITSRRRHPLGGVVRTQDLDSCSRDRCARDIDNDSRQPGATRQLGAANRATLGMKPPGILSRREPSRSRLTSRTPYRFLLGWWRTADHVGMGRKS
jgi:hypothetical protein